MRKPNLFIVGAPKCGTTSLRYFLSQHPQIWFDIDLEPNFFANDVYGFEDMTNEKNYISLFKKATNQKYVGDKSPLHLYSIEAATRIKKFSPDAKIIIIIRNPAEMIYSWHNHLFLDGIEKEENFEKALADQKNRKNKDNILRTDLYLESVKYSEQIARYFETFGRKNVKVILFDDLKKDSKKVYYEILEFLNLKKNKIDYSVQNESKYSYRSQLILKIISKLKNSPLLVRKIIKFLLPYQLRNFIRSLNMKEIKKLKPINENTRKQLVKKLSPEIKRTEKLIHRNLSAWLG